MKLSEPGFPSMRLATLIILSFLLSAPSFCIGDSVDEYWIAFSSPLKTDNDHPPGGPKFLMKIDALGNILVPPTKVITNSDHYVSGQVSGLAINHRDTQTLNMWLTNRNYTSHGYSIFRAVINKKNLKLLSTRKTSVSALYGNFVQVTQTGHADFLALDYRIEHPPFNLGFAGYRLSNLGTLTGERFLLFSKPNDCEGCGNAVSADGKAFVFTDYSIDHLSLFTVMYQRLNENSRPAGKARIVVNKSPRLTLMDVSNSLEGGRRYILYTFQSLKMNSSLLFLQTIDQRTGLKIGERIQVGKDVAGFQSVAVDPLGRFIIYVSWEDLNGTLVFQSLDATGRPSGRSKIMATYVSPGIDILKN